MSSYRSRLLAATTGAVLIVGLMGVSPAEAKDGDVRVAGTCTAGSQSKLKLGPRGGTIEADFEVDSNKVGQDWTVAISDNGVEVFTGARTTTAPSGSFSVRTRIANRAGCDDVVARATNAATGESCVARASV